MKIFQAENFSVSRQFLAQQKNYDDLVVGLRNFLKTKNYKKVGLISYKKNYEDLAQALNVCNEKAGYFGKIRGQNRWEDCDCLLILGRHNLHSHLAPKARAISAYLSEGDELLHSLTNEEIEETSTIEGIIRMENNVCVTLPQVVYKKNIVEILNHHLAKSETLQSIFRIRHLRGEQERHVYIFSCEPLGTTIEITDFFRKNDIIDSGISDEHISNDRVIRYQKSVTKMKELGFMILTPKGKIPEARLKSLGLTHNDNQHYFSEIKNCYEDNGIHHLVVKIRKPKKKFQNRTLFVAHGHDYIEALRGLNYILKDE